MPVCIGRTSAVASGAAGARPAIKCHDLTRPALRAKIACPALGAETDWMPDSWPQMTQWVFGQFSVMPVMATMGMMFALLHNFGSNTGSLLWAEDVSPFIAVQLPQ